MKGIARNSICLEALISWCPVQHSDVFHARSCSRCSYSVHGATCAPRPCAIAIELERHARNACRACPLLEDSPSVHCNTTLGVSWPRAASCSGSWCIFFVAEISVRQLRRLCRPSLLPLTRQRVSTSSWACAEAATLSGRPSPSAFWLLPCLSSCLTSLREIHLSSRTFELCSNERQLFLKLCLIR